MILKQVKVNNFKQFKDEHIVDFNTNDKITVIYGFNGFGKTRLHSFFYWLLYGKDRENEIIYNKPLLKESFTGDEIVITGELTFEHNNSDHIFLRSETYKKGNNESARKTDTDVRLRKADENGNVRYISNPEKYILEIIPEELSKYFLFDGEGMANELTGEKTNVSHKDLKEAVNTIFGLKLYENAINDIGSFKRKTSAIYELTRLLKGENGNDSPNGLRKYVAHEGQRQNDLEDLVKKMEEDTADLELENKRLSELIGKKDSGEKLEETRKAHNKNIDLLNRDRDEQVSKIGKLVSEELTFNIVSKNIENAKTLIEKNIDNNFVSGLNKKLLDNLISSEECICGSKIQEKEIEKFKNFLMLLPPKSYMSVFHEYQREAERHLSGSEEALINMNNIRLRLAEIDDEKADLDEKLDEIEKELNKIKDVQEYVNKRKFNETTIKTNLRKIKEKESEIAGIKVHINGAEKEMKSIFKNNQHNKRIYSKIDFLEKAKDSLEKTYNFKKTQYRNVLEENIKDLVNNMLSAKRTVELNENYTLSVSDNTFGTTSLSAGQAAIVSFSYIGGILRSLKNMSVEYVSKDYPLILDAPLSHLDIDHIKKVFDTLPSFSNQIIIFSKENIDEYLGEKEEVKKYQINSNKEANIANITKYKGSDYFTNINARRI